MKNALKIISLLAAALFAFSLFSCAKGGGSDVWGGTDTTENVKTNETDKPVTTAQTEEPTQAGTTAPETEELPYTVVSLKEAGAGDVVIFGSYEQDGDGSNGKEPIEWLVLEKSGSSVLVISLYALETGVFNEERDEVTWETSDMREWLNGAFLNTAFSADEQTAIATTTVIAESSPEFPNVPAGGDTTDKIFLLSIQEVERYFEDSDKAKCSPSDALIASGRFAQSNKPWYAKQPYACVWWLRSPGMDKLKIAYVDKGGSVSYGGNQIDYDNATCIRPAMRLLAG